MNTINYYSPIAIEPFTSRSKGIVKTETLFPLLECMRKDSISYFHLLPRDIVEHLISPYLFSARLQNPVKVDNDIEKNRSLLTEECDAISSIAISLIGFIEIQNDCQNSLKLVREYTTIFFDLIMQIQIKHNKTLIQPSSRIGGKLTIPLVYAQNRFNLAYSTLEIKQLISDLDLVPSNSTEAVAAIGYVHIYISDFRNRRLQFEFHDNFDIDKSMLTLRAN